MGLGGISVWRLILILLIALCSVAAVVLPHRADTPAAAKEEPAEEAEGDESDEDPPLGVG